MLLLSGCKNTVTKTLIETYKIVLFIVNMKCYENEQVNATFYVPTLTKTYSLFCL